MNIVFWALVVAALVLVWFCAASLFRPIGSYFLSLFWDVKDELEQDKNTKSKQTEEK